MTSPVYFYKYVSNSTVLFLRNSETRKRGNSSKSLWIKYNPDIKSDKNIIRGRKRQANFSYEHISKNAKQNIINFLQKE